MQSAERIENAIDKVLMGGSMSLKKSPQAVLQFIDLSRKGLTYIQYKNLLLMDEPFPLKDWAKILNINIRTLERYKKNRQKLDVTLSGKVLEIIRLLKRGIDVFGDYDILKQWLNTKNLALGNNSPKELLDTNFGIDLVMDELTRIEHGVLA